MTTSLASCYQVEIYLRWAPDEGKCVSKDERKILLKEDLIRCNAVCSGSRCTECVTDRLECDFRHARNDTLEMDAKM